MKLFQVQNLLMAIDRMGDKALPAKVSYAFYRNKDRLIKIMEPVEKTRLALVKKYADKTDEGEPKSNLETGEAIFKPENRAAFNKEYNEFLAQEADVTLYLIDFDWIAHIEIEGYLMDSIIHMIKTPDFYSEFEDGTAKLLDQSQTDNLKE